MRERQFEPRRVKDPQRTPDPKRFEKTHGREVNLPAVEVLFRRLEPGEDYTPTEVNLQVQCEQPVQDFVLFVDPTRGTEHRRVNPPHWRTVSTEDIHATVTSRPGTGAPRTAEFYEANTKGAGFLKPFCEGLSLDDYETWTYTKAGRKDTLGMMDLSALLAPRHILPESQFLFEQGLRAEVYWTCAQLHRVPRQGSMQTIEQLAGNKVIPKKKGMGIAVRLLRNNDRIAECAEADERREAIFEKAFDRFNRENMSSKLGFPELHIGDPDHERLFITKFARRMGGNLAVLCNIGFLHYHLHSSNVTMAAEVVDIESMIHWQKLNATNIYMKEYDGVRVMYLKDMRDAVYGIKKLLLGARRAGLHCPPPEQIVEELVQGFLEQMDPEQFRVQKTDPSGAEQWLRAIAHAALVEGRRLMALKNEKRTVDIEEWGLQP